MTTMMGARCVKTKPLKSNHRAAKSRILKTITENGRVFELHATKGWRSRKAELAPKGDAQ